jgi:hypothetical protein
MEIAGTIKSGSQPTQDAVETGFAVWKSVFKRAL